MSDDLRALGPSERFEKVRRDPMALAVVLQCFGQGRTPRQLCRAWAIPRREFLEWLHAEGKRLALSRSPNRLRLVKNEPDAGLI